MLPATTVPVRIVTWRLEEGVAVIIAPRWGKGFLCRFLARLLFLTPNVRLPLDEMGTIIWKQCDGTKTVEEIVESVQAHYKDESDRPGAMVWRYLNGLKRQHWIQYYKDYESIPDHAL